MDLWFFLHQQAVEHNPDQREGKLVSFSLFADFGHDARLRPSIHDHGLRLFRQSCNNPDGFAHGKLVQPANPARAANQDDHRFWMRDIEFCQCFVDFLVFCDVDRSDCSPRVSVEFAW